MKIPRVRERSKRVCWCTRLFERADQKSKRRYRSRCARAFSKWIGGENFARAKALVNHMREKKSSKVSQTTSSTIYTCIAMKFLL